MPVCVGVVCHQSNLLLSQPMAFAVHARFWLQPHLLLHGLLPSLLLDPLLLRLLPGGRRAGREAVAALVVGGAALAMLCHPGGHGGGEAGFYVRAMDRDARQHADAIQRWAAASSSTRSERASEAVRGWSLPPSR